MSRNIYDDLDNLIKPFNKIPGNAAAASTLSAAYDFPAIQSAMALTDNPMITAAQEIVSRFEGITRPFKFDGIYRMENELAQRMDLMNGLDLTRHQEWLKNLSGLTGRSVFDSIGIAKALEQMRPTFSDDIQGITATSVGVASAIQNSGISSMISDLYRNVPTFTTAFDDILPRVDLDALSRITDNVLSRQKEWDIGSAAEAIANEYEDTVSVVDEGETADKLSAKKHISVKEAVSWLEMVLGILASLVAIIQFFSPSSVANNYNITKQVNNYYIVGYGCDAEELNIEKYMIINQDIIVRLKHDCHFAIVARLEEGQVIRIIDKYKKWRQITWTDEDGETCMGWIQNYKLTEFRNPKKGR